MNLVQTNLLREVAAEVKAHGGLLQFKSHALKNLELRTVLKESHCSPIVDLVFNALDPEHRNLFASIGKDQVTIYDDEHMGDFLGVVVQYINSPSAHHHGGDVTCCAWVQMSGITTHELGDACLAVSGPEGVIQVISVVEARVITLLKGHRGEVVELRGCPGVPGLLLSLGLDSSIRLWDVAAGICLAEMASDAITLETHPEGGCFFTGHSGGRICRWNLDLDITARVAGEPSGEKPVGVPDVSPTEAVRDAPVPSGGLRGPEPRLGPIFRLALRGVPPTPQQLALPSNPLGDVVDCVRCLSGERLAAKSSDGKLVVWDLGRGVQVLSLRIPGTHPPAGAGQGAAAALRNGRCRFSVTRDGDFICVGNPAGDVYVYDTSSGARAAHYSAQKVRGAARAAALSEDGRHLLTVHGNGYILRYEYIRKQQLRKRAVADADALDVAQAGGTEAPSEHEARDGADGDVDGAAGSSREASPEAFTEDDTSAALDPGTAAAEPARAQAKRPRPTDGDASESYGVGSGSVDDGGGDVGRAESAGRRIKLRVRLGPRPGGGVVVVDGVGLSAGGGAVASMPGKDRDTSTDAEWSGAVDE
ncbi:hypothetical protein Vretimale_4757 [Volvox reticuliferus]|uniref:Uncharacterized protein n=1 Tax=Volvox reticuliferus TaxID=1737510 RepID=A0A8J4C295_9CHLO|nr:hypothetical protein Vretifemale_3360 [Volvox reticuliferus]GIL99637.1 hypothetical protein Vretimale_4757 [Volvox reticuliferus]